MNSRNVDYLLLVSFLWGSFFVSDSPAWATVYGWKSEGGVLHLSNDPTEAPTGKRDSVQQFTSKFAQPATDTTAASTTTPPEAPPQPAPSINLETSAYERGLEKGMRTAERQVELATQLAQVMLAATPRTPPTQVIVQQSSPVIIQSTAPGYYPPPFYNYGWYRGPYLPDACVSSRFLYAPSFRCRRFLSHSHFFPDGRGRGAAVFFPYGHFSHHGFLFGPRFRSW